MFTSDKALKATLIRVAITQPKTPLAIATLVII